MRRIQAATVRARVLGMAGAAALLLVLTTAAAQSSGRQVETTGATNYITFGATMSLTGGLAAEAKTAKDGYDFIVDRLNKRGGITIAGKKYLFRIKYYDDQSNANNAVTLYEKLINEDKVDFLLGPYSSGVTLATSTVAEKYHIPMVVAHAATPAIYERGYKYLFGTLNVIGQYTEPLFKMAKAIKSNTPKTVAIMHENALAPTAFADSAAATPRSPYRRDFTSSR